MVHVAHGVDLAWHGTGIAEQSSACYELDVEPRRRKNRTTAEWRDVVGELLPERILGPCTGGLLV